MSEFEFPEPKTPPLTEDELAALNSAPEFDSATYKTSRVAERKNLSPLPLASLLENVPPEPEWLLRGYVAPFAVTLLAGRPKVGKSTLLFAFLSRLVAGMPFAGVETTAAGALVLTEERRDTLAEKARILGLLSFPPPTSPIAAESNSQVHIQLRNDLGALAWPEIVRQAITYCAQHNLRVLVVDTWDRWTSLRGDSENTAGATNEALEPLHYAAASGLAVVIVTHQRKSLGEFGEAVRGSNALTGGVDVVLELERPAASLGLGHHARALRAVSRFAATPDELYVDLDEHRSEYVAIDSPEEVKTAADLERILAAVGDVHDAAAIAADLDMKAATVRRRLKTLRERGLVRRDGTGRKGSPFLWFPINQDNADDEEVARLDDVREQLGL